MGAVWKLGQLDPTAAVILGLDLDIQVYTTSILNSKFIPF